MNDRETAMGMHMVQKESRGERYKKWEESTSDEHAGGNLFLLCCVTCGLR